MSCCPSAACSLGTLEAVSAVSIQDRVLPFPGCDWVIKRKRLASGLHQEKTLFASFVPIFQIRLLRAGGDTFPLTGGSGTVLGMVSGRAFTLLRQVRQRMHSHTCTQPLMPALAHSAPGQAAGRSLSPGVQELPATTLDLLRASNPAAGLDRGHVSPQLSDFPSTL